MTAPRPLTPEQEQQARDRAARLQLRAADAAFAIARTLVATTDATLFGDTEFTVRDHALGLVATAYDEHLREKKTGYQGSSIDCPNPECRATAAFHSYRDRTAHSLGGPVHCDRAYYDCRSCGTGTCPWDAAVGLTDRRLTPAVERLATLTGGVADSFDKGADVLAETAGIRLSESTVERTTEAAGQRIADAFAAGRLFGPRAPWAWYRDATGQPVGYGSIDATGVAQQGHHGEKAEGRMAYVGMVFNPLPHRDRVFEGLPTPGARQQSRSISGLYPLAEMGPLLRRQAAQVGLDRAAVWVALSDGGAGLEDLLRTQFPRAAAVILDFYHAAEHLGALAKAVHPGTRPRLGRSANSGRVCCGTKAVTC